MKPNLNQRLAIYLIGALIALLMLPNLIWFAHTSGPIVWIQALAVPLLLLLFLFAFCGRWPWIACLLLTPFALLAPLETFFVAQYHHPTSSEVMATLFATNPRETREYLGAAMIPLAFCLLTALALPLVAAWMSWRSGFRWGHKTREWLLVIALMTPLVIAVSSIVAAKGNVRDSVRTMSSTLSTLLDSVEPGYPFGIFQRMIVYHEQMKEVRADAAKLAAFRFNAHRDVHSNEREIYVLVIGESSRRDHWQLFGYNRSTNPELANTPNLIPIGHMITSWPESIMAIPLILTRKPITSMSPVFGEASILRAMHEAGFETYWISNQLPLGKFDSPVATYAYEADHVQWLNHASWTAPGSYDEDLVQPLRDAINSSNRDLFIVLHMMGSHLSYDYRYPASFKRFYPTFSDKNSPVPQGERLRNSYDNTILYTDHVLAQIIGALRETEAATALWFESDHGETLPTPTCSHAGHGLGSRYDFQIPALFWYSNAYAALHPQRIRILHQNANKLTLSADTFESIADMAGINFPSHDETRSLFSSRWLYRPRIVNPLWQTDYDKSVFGKGCEIVLPPSTSKAVVDGQHRD